MRYVFLLLLAMQCWTGQATSHPAKWRDELVRKGISAMDELIAKNADNDRKGLSHLNSYILNLDKAWSGKGEFVEERGDGPEHAYTLLKSDELSSLDEQLKAFHSLYSPAKEVGFYVILVNNYEILLRRKLSEEVQISKLEDFRHFMDQDKQNQLAEIRGQINGVVKEIFAGLRQKGYTRNTYGALYAVLSAYDLNAPEPGSGIIQEQVKPVTFLAVAFNKSDETPQAEYSLIKEKVPSGKYLINNYPTAFPRIQELIKGFEAGYKDAKAFASRSEEATAFGIEEGPGLELFLNLPADKNLTGDNKLKFVELCKYLNSETEGKAFAFYHAGVEKLYQDGMSMLENTLRYLYENDILTTDFFENHFYPNYSRDYDILFSVVDLRKDIPSDYNEFSIDWTSYHVGAINSINDLESHLSLIESTINSARQETDLEYKIEDAAYSRIEEYVNDCRANAEHYVNNLRITLPQTLRTVYIMLGYYDKYEYSFGDLIKRHELQASDAYFYNNIRVFEEAGQASAITSHENYDQYVGQYNTDKSYFLGQEFDNMMGVINMAFYGQQIIKQVSGLRQAFVKSKRLRAARLRNYGYATNKLASKLTGDIKKTYDELVGAGLISRDEGHMIRLLSQDGEDIAFMTATKFTPIKWKAFSKSTTKVETSEGYWLVKDADDVGIDLGFKEGRILDAAEVNAYWKYGKKGYEPYKVGTKVIERSLQDGETLYVVEYIEQERPGTFACKDRIRTIAELREDLAILKDWKDQDLTFLTVREYQVKSSLKVREGVIGPQMEETGIDKGKILNGGGHQYEFLERWDIRTHPHDDYLKFIVNHEIKQ